jgi:hypothetical protein
LPGISAFVTQDEGIETLANAYGVPVSVDAIADAIVSDSALETGERERDALIAVVNVLVTSEGAIESVQRGEALPLGTLPAMADAARVHLMPTDTKVESASLPEVSPAALVEMATRSVRSQLI